MKKDDSLFSIAGAKNAQAESICRSTQGITERLLKKYKPSKALNSRVGRKKQIRSNIAA